LGHEAAAGFSNPELSPFRGCFSALRPTGPRPEDEEAELLARAFYLADENFPGNQRFDTQRVADVHGPGEIRYRVVLHPLLPRQS